MEVQNKRALSIHPGLRGFEVAAIGTTEDRVGRRIRVVHLPRYDGRHACRDPEQFKRKFFQRCDRADNRRADVVF